MSEAGHTWKWPFDLILAFWLLVLLPPSSLNVNSNSGPIPWPVGSNAVSDEVPVLANKLYGIAILSLFVFLLTGFLLHHQKRQTYLCVTKRQISGRRAEHWLTNLAFWIPRQYRQPIVGDLMEDCCDMRNLGFSEWRIRIHVIWQLAWALILLRPTALMDALKRILSTK